MALRAAQARARKALVDRAAAQKLPVIRVPKFLDDGALNAIDALGTAHALVHGPPVASRTAWRTQYLNADGLARTKAGELLDRLVTLVALFCSGTRRRASTTSPASRKASHMQSSTSSLPRRCLNGSSAMRPFRSGSARAPPPSTGIWSVRLVSLTTSAKRCGRFEITFGATSRWTRGRR